MGLVVLMIRWVRIWSREAEGRRKSTSMMAGCPLTPTLSFVFVMTTFKSRPFRLPDTGTVTSTSWIVCVHLYGSLACSSASLARATVSFFSRSSGVGEVDMVEYNVIGETMTIQGTSCLGVSPEYVQTAYTS